MKQIFETQQDRIEYGHSGQVIIHLNENEITQEIENPVGEIEQVKRYEYDTDQFVAAQADEASVLEAYKQAILARIDAFDSSAEVNSFLLAGQPCWLNKSTRVGLQNSISIEKAAGNKNTTMWLKGSKITIGVDKALSLLNVIELYALACYNKTAENKAAVEAASSLEDLINFDYKSGYPDKVEATI